MLVKSGSCERHTMAELSMLVSPILSMPAPVGVMSLKHIYIYLLAIYHSTGSRMVINMNGEAQLP